MYKKSPNMAGLDYIDEELFQYLERVAGNGTRAPTGIELNNVFVGRSPIVRILKMCELGYLISWIYGKNWRVIEINHGPMKGKRTAAPPHGGKPFLSVPRGALAAVEMGGVAAA